MTNEIFNECDRESEFVPSVGSADSFWMNVVFTDEYLCLMKTYAVNRI